MNNEAVNPEVIENVDQIKQITEITKSEMISVSISDDESYQTAVSFGGKVKAHIKRIKEYFAPRKQRLDEAHTVMCQDEKNALAPFLAIEAEIKRQGIAYTTAKEEERQRQIEQQKREAETKRKQEIEDAKAFGGEEEAAAVASMPCIPAAVPPPSVLKPKGSSMPERSRYEIVDASLVPRDYLMVDEKKVKKYGDAMGKSASIPGVKFWMEKTMSLRAS